MATNKTQRDQLKKEVFAFYLKNRDIPFHKYHEINPNFPKHHNTIKRYVEELNSKEENGELIKKTYNEKIIKENKTVFDYLERDSQETIETISILKKAIKGKGLKAEDDLFTSIKDIAITYGIMIEKEVTLNQLAINMQKLDIERKRLNIQEKQLELKQKELDLRISNPESFSAVNIIADIPGGELYGDKAKRDNSTTLS